MPFRTDWRLICLLPAASFGVVLLLGFLCWYFLMLQVSPNFGTPQFSDAASARAALGAAFAGKHTIVTATMLFIAALLLMVVAAGWTIWQILAEVRSDDLTDMSGADALLSVGLVAVIVSIPALIVIFAPAQCDTTYLFECVGKGILPDLMERFAALVGAPDLRPFNTLKWAEIVSTRAIGIAGLVTLAAMVMLPRGLEDRVQDANGLPRPIPASKLKTWFTGRLRRFELLSFVVALVLVAGIAQMSTWMHWPKALMRADVMAGAEALKGNYEALTDSLLHFNAVWYGLVVATLIFATRTVLAQKCRQLAEEVLAYPATSEANREIARKLVDETFAGASPQVYFERYRTYLLALAPAIAQQVLEVLGK